MSFLSESLGAGDIDEITEEKESGNVSLAKEFKIKAIHFNGIAARNKQSKASSFFCLGGGGLRVESNSTAS